LEHINVSQVTARESNDIRDRYGDFQRVSDALEDALKWLIPKVSCQLYLSRPAVDRQKTSTASAKTSGIIRGLEPDN
jgi:hypothetical protein